MSRFIIFCSALRNPKERNCWKGGFCPSKLKGRRVIELGAGCGVAGFGMALMGWDDISTDQIDVLPLLLRNVERNTSRIMQTNPNSEEIDPEEVEEDEEDDEVEEDEEGEEEEDDDDDDDEELEIEEIGAQQGATNPETNRSGSLSFTLTDTEVLDCAICYEPLTVPVFQCENGHIACSTCCLKIRHKCPSCATPIGYSRCRAIEKVLDSVKVSCQNSKYGCKETFSYSMKQKHENLCFYTPCSCPLSTCYFEGSSNRLCKHFTDKHKYSATPFQYDTPQQLTLGVYDKFIILQEEREGSLFILHNKIETLGNIVSLSRIGPSVESGYFYDLVAKGHDDVCTLKLQSLTKSTPKRVDSPHSLGFLLVPNLLSGSNKQIKIDLQIWRRTRTPYNIRRPLGV